MTDSAASRADKIWRAHIERLGGRRAYETNASYRFQCDVLGDMLRRLEVVLEDEELPAEQIDRILRCLMYGGPSVAAAEEQDRLRELTRRALEASPLDPAALVGLTGPAARERMSG